MTTHKSEDYKVSAVNYYLTEDTTQEEVCKIFKCSVRSLMRWVDRFQEEKVNEISNYQQIIALIAFIITIIGFIHYYLLKSDEFKDNWNTKDFLIGTTTCKNNSSVNTILPEIISNSSKSKID